MQQLTLNEYQEKAMTTCLPTCNNIAYMSMNLCGEVGELLSKIAKAIRKGKLFIGTSDRDENGERIMTQTLHGVTEQEMNDIKKECGDVMWQMAGLCSVLGFSLEDVCRQNLEKLQSRQQRGLIDGDGDNR